MTIKHEARIFSRFPSIFALLLLVLVGCASLQSGRRDSSRFFGSLLSSATPTEKELSHRTLLTLRTYDLETKVKKDSIGALLELRDRIDREPTLDLVYALSELAFLEARRNELLYPDRALELYLVSATQAYGYLFDPRFQHRRNSYDPHFREACLFYNDSLEKILRHFADNHTVDLSPNRSLSISKRDGASFNFHCVHHSQQWNGEDLEPMKFASDYEIKGLQNEYRQYGLGVPLLARQKPGTRIRTATRYTPENLCFPITAILRFLPSNRVDAEGRPLHAVIELYDPLTIQGTRILHHNVPLESDLTTPIALSISDPRASHIHTFGLLRSDLLLKPINEVMGRETPAKGVEIHSETDASVNANLDDSDLERKTIKGLYMMQPHEPGKIPVIFVHGLWSSPMAWVEMFNALRAEPELRARYEFYFYFYPTGQPFWVSAAQLRDDLEDFRNTFDPTRQDPIFDNMILVGHSMGGLISHLQTLESGDEFWRLVADVSPEELLGDRPQDSREEIRKWFFFRANPSIRRVVTIATPHQGSRASNDLTQWLGRKVIRLPENLMDTITALGGNQKLKENSLLKVKTSIDSLAPGQPIFETMEQRRELSQAVYHNIIGEIEQNTAIKRMFPPSDGVVKTESAHLERSKSEITVQCEHTSIHSHPKTILEVRRILFEHLRP